MKQTDITPPDWSEFCEEFSRAHNGWLVTLAKISPSDMDRNPEDLKASWEVVVSEAPFRKIDIDQQNGECLVEMQDDRKNITYRLNGVVRLSEIVEEGVRRGVRIDTIDGNLVLLDKKIAPHRTPYSGRDRRVGLNLGWPDLETVPHGARNSQVGDFLGPGDNGSQR